MRNAGKGTQLPGPAASPVEAEKVAVLITKAASGENIGNMVYEKSDAGYSND